MIMKLRHLKQESPQMVIEGESFQGACCSLMY